LRNKILQKAAVQHSVTQSNAPEIKQPHQWDTLANTSTVGVTKMNLMQIVVTAVLTTLTVFALGIVGVWSVWPKTAEAGVNVATHAASFSSAGDHCARLDTGHIELGEAIVTAALDLDDSQQAALAPISAALENWRTQAASLCSEVNFDDLDSSLAGLENMLRVSATTVGELRPAMGQFHALLTEEQHAKLKQYMQHRHDGRRSGSRFRHGFGH
jgi:hypothetical protein